MSARAVSCLFGLSLAGCALATHPTSGEIATRDLSVQVEAMDTGSGTALTTTLSGPFGRVDLVDGDLLRITASDGRHAVARDQNDGGLIYVANVGFAEGELALDVDRPHDRAVHLAVPLPPNFTLDAAVVGDALSITWDADPGSYDLGLAVTGGCIRTLQRSLAIAPGPYNIVLAELSPTTPGATCPLTITVMRTLSSKGSVLSDVASGSFTTHAVRSRTVEVPW